MKPHSVDALSLVFGLLFLGIAVIWLLAWAGHPIALATLAWATAAGLVALGLVGIAYALVAGRGDRARKRSD